MSLWPRMAERQARINGHQRLAGHVQCPMVLLMLCRTSALCIMTGGILLQLNEA